MDPLSSSKRHSRFSLSRFNPFSSKESLSTQRSKGSSFSISRSQSQTSTNQSQQQQPTQRPSTTTQSGVDPPPAYTETNVISPGASTRNQTTSRTGAYPALSAANISTKDDEFAFLSSFDTVFLIDDSGSMDGNSWAEVRSVLKEIVNIMACDYKSCMSWYQNEYSVSSPTTSVKELRLRSRACITYCDGLQNRPKGVCL
ncbi:hypothetical protein PG995_005277 [Apiospora arundinis]